MIRRVGRVVYNASSSGLSIAQDMRDHFRFRKNYVIERWAGERSLAGARRVAVFVHYDRRGRVHDYVLHYLAALTKAGFEIVFVSNSPKEFRENVWRARPLCGLILRRKNVGYDFGAYKDGWLAIPDIARLDELILANDSAYGPFSDLAPLLSRCDDSAAIWGMTDSWDSRFHLQSYFLLFRKEALTNARMLAFWRKVRYFQSKRSIIRKYEVGLTQEAIRGGLRCAALFSQHRVVEALSAAVLSQNVLKRDGLSEPHRAYLQRVFDAVDHGLPLNITHFFWDHLIADLGCPFLKRELLTINPMGVPFLHQWHKLIERTTSYDPDLIMRHLEATMQNRAV
jgi:lipopolysaccharide biosynthesis protein